MRSFAILSLVAACNGFDTPAQPGTGGQPFANAGIGSFYPVGTTIMLDGTGSFDPDGTIVEYLWSLGQEPPGSSALPVDATSAMSSFTLDAVGDYVLRLVVRDDAQNTDTSEVRIVSMGSILAIDAGPDAGVAWHGTAELTGTVATKPGTTAMYAWTFVSRPAGSVATLANAATLTPTFVADAVGNYVVSLEARIGNEVRKDTVTVQSSDITSVGLGSDAIAFAYTKLADQIVYIRDVGHAELVKVDPMIGTQAAVNIGSFVPRSISVDQNQQYAAVGGPGRVVTVAVVAAQPTLVSSRAAPGCSAGQVAIPYESRVDCFPVDGSIEPISSVNMMDGVVTQIACPLQLPSVSAVTSSGHMYMADAASEQIYLYDAFASPPLRLLDHWTISGVTAPVFAGGGSLPYAVTGNGVVVSQGTVLFDLQFPVSAAAYNDLTGALAVATGNKVKIFDYMHLLKQTVTLPSVNGTVPSVMLVAYSSDDHRLIVVAHTQAGDIAYTVPQ